MAVRLMPVESTWQLALFLLTDAFHELLDTWSEDEQ